MVGRWRVYFGLKEGIGYFGAVDVIVAKGIDSETIVV